MVCPAPSKSSVGEGSELEGIPIFSRLHFRSYPTQTDDQGSIQAEMVTLSHSVVTRLLASAQTDPLATVSTSFDCLRAGHI